MCVEDMVGSQITVFTVTLLLRKRYLQTFKFVGIFIEEINRAFGSVYKSSKYAMLNTRFTVLIL